MTKKSLARQQRDAKEREDDLIAKSLKGNTIWNDLLGIYNNYVAGINTVKTNLIEQANTPGLLKFVRPEDVGRVKVSMEGLGADIVLLEGELNDIRSKHSAKTGGAVDIDDHADALAHYENYQQFDARFQSVITPTVNYLAVTLGNAGEAMKVWLDMAEKLNSQDPAVITDALVKENAELATQAEAITPAPAEA